MEDIGKMIREIRKRKKLTIYTLADVSGVPWNTIARLERGEHDPKWDTLKRIFNALDLELAPRRIAKDL